MFIQCLDAFTLNHLIENLGIFLDGEDTGRARNEGDLSSVTHVRLAEVVIGQIHNFLGRTATFNGTTGLSEESLTARKVFDRFPGTLTLLIGIVATETILTKVTL